MSEDLLEPIRYALASRDARIAALERDHESRCDQVDKLQQRLDEIRVAVGGYFADDLVAHIRVRMTELGKLTREKSTLERDLADAREHGVTTYRKWSNAMDKIASLEERLRKSTESKPERRVVGDVPVEGAGTTASATSAPSISSATGRPADAFDDMEGRGPCGGSRCFLSQARDGVWIHSSKSYGTCSMKKDKGFEDYREYQASKIDGPIRDEPEGAGHLREDTTPIHGSVLDPYAPRADITAERIIRAAMRMDWAQSMNGPPCFHVEDDGRFCGRASAWAGHQTLSVHLYEPLYVAITRAVKDANKSEGSATREGAVLSPSAEASRLAGSSTPSDPPAKWTEEQRRSATAVAATVAFWKERADDREIAQTCDEIAKHAHKFCGHTQS